MLETLKALADPCRLRLVAVLLSGEFTVQELTGIMRMGQSRISRHLKILTEAGVLSVKRQGTWSYYRAGGESPFFAAIRAAIVEGVAALPERSGDLAAVASVLEERRRRSLEFFDRHARQWDDLARTLLPVPDCREQLLALVPHGGTVVEIGIGTGGLLPALAARAEQVIGVDHSTAMLEETRRRLALAGLAGIELRLGEMTHLPLPDNGADCAVLNMVLHHAADPPAVLREIRRILSPSGVLVLADLARHEREWVRERLADQWLGFGEKELTSWLTAAGFKDVRCELLKGNEGQEAVLLVWAGPPPCPPPYQGGGCSPTVSGGKKSPLLDKEGVGGGRSLGIHNKPALKSVRKTLRNEATPAEQQLWNALRHSSLAGYKFRRQHSVGRYILDFYCPSEGLAIELDGDSHFNDDAIVYDKERTAFLNSLNIRVLRFLNTDVYENLDAVRERILEEIRRPTTPTL